MSAGVIAIAPSMDDFFRGALDDVVRARRLELTPGVLAYLVSLLCSYAHPGQEAEQAFSQPLTFQLRDALELAGTERFRRLRALGDSVLYAAGFFGDHIEQRGVDRGYVVSVGVTAYDHARLMLRQQPREAPGPDIFGELSVKFQKLVEVLGDFAASALAGFARTNRSLVQMYERWLKTGSTRLAGELGALGVLPRTPGGMVS